MRLAPLRTSAWQSAPSPSTSPLTIAASRFAPNSAATMSRDAVLAAVLIAAAPS